MGKWASGVGVRMRTVDRKAQKIGTRLFHNYFKLCYYYKLSDLLGARLTYWTLQVCNQPIW